MFDCANVDMRELLPDLLAGSLDAETRARVEQHAVTCADCASELETLRLVRASFGTAPRVQVGRIVGALPKPRAASVPVAGAPVRRWLDWRIAAALTTITIGGLSWAVSSRLGPHAVIPAPQGPVAVVRVPDAISAGSSPNAHPANAHAAAPAPARGSDRATAVVSTAGASGVQLTFGGGVGDLDDAALRSLLGALDEIDRAPMAPSAEPDPAPVLPVIQEDGR